MTEVFNAWLEHWEPLWLWFVLYFDGLFVVLTYIYVKREWESSRSLDKKFEKFMGKYIKRLEDTHYDLVRKILRKQKRKR